MRSMCYFLNERLAGTEGLVMKVNKMKLKLGT